MKKLYLATALFFLVLLAPLDAHAATKLKTPSFKETVSPVIYRSATYHISTKKGYTYYYTTDGKTPTKKSKKYNKSIKILDSQTLKVIAYKGKDKSKVYTQKFTVQDSLVVPSVKSGTYKKGFTVKYSLANTDKYDYCAIIQEYGSNTSKEVSLKNGSKITINNPAEVAIMGRKKGSSTDFRKAKCEESYYYYINKAGISGKYASGIYKKAITPSFTTKKSVESFKYDVLCVDKKHNIVDKYSKVFDTLPELKSGYDYSIVVIANHSDGTRSAKLYTYRIK